MANQKGKGGENQSPLRFNLEGNLNNNTIYFQSFISILLKFYPMDFSASQRSASSAAAQPVPAAVTAWRYL